MKYLEPLPPPSEGEVLTYTEKRGRSQRAENIPESSARWRVRAAQKRHSKSNYDLGRAQTPVTFQNPGGGIRANRDRANILALCSQRGLNPCPSTADTIPPSPRPPPPPPGGGIRSRRCRRRWGGRSRTSPSSIPRLRGQRQTMDALTHNRQPLLRLKQLGENNMGNSRLQKPGGTHFEEEKNNAFRKKTRYNGS